MKNLAAWAVRKRDAPGTQDERCAYTQTRIERYLNVGDGLESIFANAAPRFASVCEPFHTIGALSV